VKTFLLPALLLLGAPSLRAAKPSPEEQLLSSLVQRAGGTSKFLRLQTFSCRFEETVASTAGPRVRRGEWALRAEEGRILRAWEKDDAGAVVEVSSSPASPAQQALLADVSWLFLPHLIRQGGRPLRKLSAGFFVGRLADRASVEGDPLFAGAEGLVLYLDRADGKLLGASGGPESRVVAFLTPETSHSLLVFHTLFLHHDAAGKRARAVKVSDITVNGYLDEARFKQGAVP
jgi:hypothetical protein